MSTFFQKGVFDDVKQFFIELPDIAETAAVLAMNQVVEREGLSMSRKEMRKQVDFPPGYLEGERLQTGRKARKGLLEASIKGRDRATSLARFAAGQTRSNTKGKGVRVMIKPGQTRVLKGAFIVDLKNGNRGVAVRLKNGDTLRNSEKAVRLADNVYLLYGPSVEQVFRGVSADVAPALGGELSRQFLRQFARLTNRG